MGRKIFCGRNKLGLICQAVADVRGRILDMSKLYGGASSDCFDFKARALYDRLEIGLLQDGFDLFGDKA